MDKANIEDIYRLSPLQEGMLSHTLRDPSSGVYTEQMTRLVEGLDADRWERAWRGAVARFPVLRTSILWTDLEKPVQVVMRRADFSVTRLDWSGLPQEELEARLDAFLKETQSRGFDLSRGPLMSVHVIDIGSGRRWFVWCYHHIILDGWSAYLVLDDVFARYAATGEEGSSPEPQAAPFKAYIQWLQRRDLAADEAFWRAELKGFRSPTPVGLPTRGEWGAPELPDTPRTAGEYLPESSTAAAEAFCRRNRVTLGTLLQSAWALVLSRYSNETDVVFGSTFSGRPPDLVGVESMVGIFINTLPVRVRVPHEAPVVDWLRGFQDRLLAVRDHESTPLPSIQRWSEVPAGTPLFDTMIAVETFPVSAHGAYFRKRRDVRISQITNYPLTLVAEPGERLHLKCIYNEATYAPDLIGRLLGHFAQALEGLSSGRHASLGEIVLLSPAERLLMLGTWNDTVAPCANTCIHTFVEARARAVPGALAVKAGDRAWTYSELNARANRVAHALIATGVGPGSLVVLLMRRCPEMIAGLLGIVKAGAAYVPIDPAYPRARIKLMLDQVEASHVVTQGRLASLVEGRSAIDVEALLAAPATAGEEADPGPRAIPEDLLYVIFTSGSTGAPKAAGVYHRGFVNLMESLVEAYAFREDDKNLLINSISFDLSQKNIFGALMTGGELHLSVSEHFDPSLILPTVASEGITWINCTPSMAYALIDFDDRARLSDLTSLRYLLLGGEPVNKVRLAPWTRSEHFRGEIINTYGPTECSDLCSVHRFGREEIRDEAIPVTVGAALRNIRLYVLDRCNNPVPIGVQGEVAIGGMSIGMGYLNSAPLTADKFFPDPFEPGARLYRTGDLGRFFPDGTVEVLGRVDFQVKLRGFRIELEEVECAMAAHPAVREAVATVRVDAEGNKRLVGYVVAGPGAAAFPGQTWLGDLKASLKERLPHFMVPSAVVLLDEIPLNGNGKVDRGAMPQPSLFDSEERVLTAPREGTEAKLAAVWKQVLGVKEVGAESDFFELGGDSLSLTKVFSRLGTAFGVTVPLSALFTHTNLADLARKIDSLRPAAAEAEPPAVAAFTSSRTERLDRLPLSFPQQRLWFLDQMHPGDPLYNVPHAIRFDHPLDAGGIRRALALLIARHESLRTVFGSEGGRPFQRALPPGEPALHVTDLADLAPEAREAEIGRIATEEARAPFDLAAGPLMRCRWVTWSEGGAPVAGVLFATLHHIVTDGWSMGLLTRELRAVCASLATGGEPSLPPIAMQYGDYAVAQRDRFAGSAVDGLLAPWSRRLAGEIPALELPADSDRPGAEVTEGGWLEASLGPDLSEAVRALARAEGATPFMVLATAYYLLLRAWSGQEDICIGTPVANRNREEIEGTVGFFVNSLPLRIRAAGRPSVRDLLACVRDVTLEAFDAQDVPFELLVERFRPDRSSSRNPFFDVMLSLQEEYEDLSHISKERWISKFALTLSLADTPRGFAGSWEYRSSLFRPATVRRMQEHFRRICAFLVERPGASIGELELLVPADLAGPARRLQNPGRRIPADETLSTLFEALASTFPDRTAILGSGVVWTYAELGLRADRAALRLRSAGVGPDSPVGLCAGRSPDLLAAILGILKAGGHYVPLDPDLPEARVRLLMERTGMRVVVAEPAHLGRFAGGAAAALDLVTLVDPDGEGVGAEAVGPSVGADSLAYVLFTSGTTGEPKGVCVTHRSIIRLVKHAAWLDVRPEDRFALHSPLSFDASTLEIWGGLLNGAAVAVFPAHPLTLEEMGSLVCSHGVTILWLTAGLMHLMAETRLADLAGVRHLLAGGEVLSPAHALRAARALPRLDNGYGPTECTTFAVIHTVDPTEKGPIPIGLPITGTEAWVMDPDLNRLPPGIPGELCLGGDGLARGYLGDARATAERFVPDPSGGGRRLYRTGDRVRYRDDGTLEFLGRLDDQIKIRGFRIEPREIEDALGRLPGVARCKVALKGSTPETKRLVGYVVPEEGRELAGGVLRQGLEERLPRHMVPTSFVILEDLPLKPNGKVDLARLPEPAAAASAAYVEPRNEDEALVASVWVSLLGVERVGAEDSFFDLGGHSLLATQALAKIRELTGANLSLRAFFEVPTVAGLAEALVQARWTSEPVVAREDDEVGVV